MQQQESQQQQQRFNYGSTEEGRQLLVDRRDDDDDKPTTATGWRGSRWTHVLLLLLGVIVLVLVGISLHLSTGQQQLHQESTPVQTVPVFNNNTNDDDNIDNDDYNIDDYDIDDYNIDHDDDIDNNNTIKHENIPFPMIDRADYGDPVSNIMQVDLLAPSLRDKPFPTGAYWVNLVLPPTADHGISYPIAVYPYAYKWSPAGSIFVSYPAAHRKQDDISIHDYFFPDLEIQAPLTTKNEVSRQIVHHDELSVTLKISSTDDEESSYALTHLVQGSPYVTMECHNWAFSLRAIAIFKSFSSLEEQQQQQDDDDVLSITDNRFLAIDSFSGMTWLIHTSKVITLTFDTRIRTTISAKEPFTGVIRLSILPTTSTGTGSENDDSNSTKNIHQQSSADATALDRLVKHASVYPVGATVTWTFRSSAADFMTTTGRQQRIATITFQFKTKTFRDHDSKHNNNDGDLLMLALPHHVELLLKNNVKEENEFLSKIQLDYLCIKGRMIPIVGSRWTFDETLPSIGFFHGPESNLQTDDNDDVSEKILKKYPTVRKQLLENLKLDVRLALPVKNENIYGYGKQSARLANLVLIANELLINSSSSSSSTKNDTKNDDDDDDNELKDLYESSLSKLYECMTDLLDHQIDDTLMYDTNLGGIVTIRGLENTEEDYGNGRYNDHHFHYGYVLYAAAALGHLKPDFVEKYSDHVNAIYHDVANHRGNSNMFPPARHLLWFDGHSFASGLFPFGNGKSQESSSEAVNCYFGAYLWSVVSGQTQEQVDFAHLLLMTEIRGAQTYWHMNPNDDERSPKLEVYPNDFAKNYMVGNVGMLDVVCSTWFGTEKLYVHMINFMPVTAAAAALFNKDYAKEEYKNVLSHVGEVDQAWRGYVVANHAIADPQAGWKEALELFSPTLDAGLSKTQVLMFVATREGFELNEDDVVVTATTTTNSSSSSSTLQQDGSVSSSSCSANPLCVAANLLGECCPTTTGVQLGCCDQ